MPSETYELVRRAIQERKIVIAEYDGHLREMCPHVIGCGPSGNEQALCYQFAGGSSRGLDPPGSEDNWRCVAIEKLRNVRLADGVWYTGPNHSCPQTCVARIDLEVKHT